MVELLLPAVERQAERVLLGSRSLALLRCGVATRLQCLLCGRTGVYLSGNRICYFHPVNSTCPLHKVSVHALERQFICFACLKRTVRGVCFVVESDFKIPFALLFGYFRIAHIISVCPSRHTDNVPVGVVDIASIALDSTFMFGHYNLLHRTVYINRFGICRWEIEADAAVSVRELFVEQLIRQYYQYIPQSFLQHDIRRVSVEFPASR